MSSYVENPKLAAFFKVWTVWTVRAQGGAEAHGCPRVPNQVPRPPCQPLSPSLHPRSFPTPGEPGQGRRTPSPGVPSNPLPWFTNYHTTNTRAYAYSCALAPQVLSLSLDKAGNSYISTMEARKYPVTAAQWHPEKNP